MTSLGLLFWIVLGVLLQSAILLGAGFLRHWSRYRQLQLRADDIESGTPSPSAETAAVSAWQGQRSFRVTHKVAEDAGASVCSFHLVPEDGKPLPAFLPGQFLTFHLDVAVADGTRERIVRCYSLSGAPSPDHCRVSIKRVPAPAGRGDLPPGRSSNHFHDHVEVGSVLQVGAPAGHFHLDAGTGPVVLIGGGIGITPMLSMLNWSLAGQSERELWLFYGVRNSREHAMKNEIETLAAAHGNFKLHVCYSDPLPGDVAGRDYHHAGRVGVDLLRLELPLKPYHFYICGPTPMMASLVAGLEDWGVPDGHIHFEAFGPASVKRRRSASVPEGDGSTAQGDVVVTFARSGKQLPWQPDAGTLLEFAEREGVAVSSGCRAGGCGTCQTMIKAGEVAYPQPPDFDPEPGNCLLCVCVPKTSVTLEA
jgi:ferredoxin-NADP reductase